MQLTCGRHDGIQKVSSIATGLWRVFPLRFASLECQLIVLDRGKKMQGRSAGRAAFGAYVELVFFIAYAVSLNDRSVPRID